MLTPGLDQRGGKKRRDAARHEKRRKAAFFLNHDSSSHQRRRMLQTEAKELFEAILRNQAAAFGLAKLSQLDLNDCFDKDGNVVVDGTGAGQTLLEFSVMQNRDNITRALCSAGADPLKAVAMSRFQGSKKDKSEQEEKEEDEEGGQ